LLSVYFSDYQSSEGVICVSDPSHEVDFFGGRASLDPLLPAAPRVPDENCNAFVTADTASRQLHSIRSFPDYRCRQKSAFAMIHNGVAARVMLKGMLPPS